MAAYLIVDVCEVTDEAKIEQYRKGVREVIARFGGRYLAAGGDPQAVEGKWTPGSVVIVEFPSREHANRWYNSEDYRELKALRQAAARMNLVLVDGLG